MKCYAMQKPKHKLSAKAKKELQKDLDEYMRLSMICGHKKALAILKESKNRNQGNKKMCETCQYYDTDRQDQPCCGCANGCNYEESEEKE